MHFLQSTEDRLNQFKDLLAEKDSEIVQVAEEKELRKLNEKIGQLRASGDLEQAQELERQRAASEAEVTEYLE